MVIPALRAQLSSSADAMPDTYWSAFYQPIHSRTNLLENAVIWL